ncbi:hypothetical protein HanIR_Chr05g0213691 [Helianthus annuus]|nr:hypothetical protein HanIR_Chr05g0213691 [Helianthus annuus]
MLKETEGFCSKFLFKKVNKYVYFSALFANLHFFSLHFCCVLWICNFSLLFKKMKGFKFLFYGSVCFDY